MGELKLLTKHAGEKDSHTIKHYQSVGGYTAVKKALGMTGDEIVDVQPPTLVSATAITNSQLDLLFSEPVGGANLLLTSNYTINPSVVVGAVSVDGTNAALLHLNLASSLTNGQNYTVTVSTMEDAFGNTATNLTGNFSYLIGETAVKGDILISEIMVDPSPVIGLPELEFIEIYNKSSKYIDLSNWKLGDQSGLTQALLHAAGEDQHLAYALSWHPFLAGTTMLEALCCGSAW